MRYSFRHIFTAYFSHSFSIYSFILFELCLSLPFSRECTVISPLQRKNVNFLKVKKKNHISISFLSIMMTEIIVNNPQVRKISYCHSQALYLLFLCFFIISSFIFINPSFYSLLFFINTPFLYLLDHVVV